MKHHLKYLCACACTLGILSSCGQQPTQQTLTILHTNDTHSQVEPLPITDHRNPNMGGYARRMGVVREERKCDPNLLLVDAGDFSQGTPFFNFFHGRVEVEAMNRMGYDAVTLGNHEFDNGLDTLAAVLKGAQFAVVCANYDVTGTPLEGIVKPYTIVEKGGVRVGIFGLGVNPNDLIAQKNFAPVRYLEPLPVMQEMGELLREKEQCDVVVCLSHLGTDNGNGVADTILVTQTRYVDVVIGGHTHQVYDGKRMLNADGKEVVLSQAGKSGGRVGKMVLHLEDDK